MKLEKYAWLVGIFLIVAVSLSSCNLGATPMPTPDLGVMQTEAFNMVMTQSAIQQTQTAAAFPTPVPTNTPLPTPTAGVLPTFAPLGGGSASTPAAGMTPLAPLAPTATGLVATVTTKNGCNDGTYLYDNGPSDWDALEAGKPYSVTFSIQNVGTCPWKEGYSFVLVEQYSTPGIKWDVTSIVIKKGDGVTDPQNSQSFTVKFTTPTTPGRYEGYWKLRDETNQPFGPQVWIKFTIK
jgi:hypothetical protein